MYMYIRSDACTVNVSVHVIYMYNVIPGEEGVSVVGTTEVGTAQRETDIGSVQFKEDTEHVQYMYMHGELRCAHCTCTCICTCTCTCN